MIAVLVAWNVVMAMCYAAVDPAWKGLLLVLTLLVDVLIAFWAWFHGRREIQSGDWVFHLEQSATPGGVLRGFVETPMEKLPRGGVKLTFASHSGDPFMGTMVARVIDSDLTTSHGGSVTVPVELSIPKGIPMPGYYRDLHIDGEGGYIHWELLCRVGPPLVGYTARFEVPGSAIHDR